MITGSPYNGPRWYGLHQSNIFFGREAEGVEIASRLLSNRPVIIHGGSGAGKSSLMHAGIVAELCEQMMLLSVKRTLIVISLRDWALPEKSQRARYWIISPAALGENIRASLSADLDLRETEVTGQNANAFSTCIEALTTIQSVMDAVNSQAPYVLFLCDQLEDLWPQPDEVDTELLKLHRSEVAGIIHTIKSGRNSILSDSLQNEKDGARHTLEPAIGQGVKWGFVGGIRGDCLGNLDRLNDSVHIDFDDLFELRLLTRRSASEAIEGPLVERNNGLVEPDVLRLLDDLSALDISSIQRFAVEGDTRGPHRREAVYRIGAEKTSLNLSKASAASKDKDGDEFIEPLMLSIVMTSLYDKFYTSRDERLRYSGSPPAVELLEAYFQACMKHIPPDLVELRDCCFSVLVTGQGRSIGKTIPEIETELRQNFGTGARSLEFTTEELRKVLNILHEPRILRLIKSPKGEARYELYHNLFSIIANTFKLRLLESRKAEAEERTYELELQAEKARNDVNIAIERASRVNKRIQRIALVTGVVVAAFSFVSYNYVRRAEEESVVRLRGANIALERINERAKQARIDLERSKKETEAEKLRSLEYQRSAVPDLFLRSLPPESAYKPSSNDSDIRKLSSMTTLAEFDGKIGQLAEDGMFRVIDVVSKEPSVMRESLVHISASATSHSPTKDGVERCRYTLKVEPTKAAQTLMKSGYTVSTAAWDARGYLRAPYFSGAISGTKTFKDQGFIGTGCYNKTYTLVNPVDKSIKAEVYRVDLCELAREDPNYAQAGCKL